MSSNTALQVLRSTSIGSPQTGRKMSMLGYLAGRQAATRSWWAARLNPRPVKFTGRLITW